MTDVTTSDAAVRDALEPTPGVKAPDPLAEGASFRGLVVISGPARILGRVQGHVSGSGRLEVGASAQLEGPVEAPEILVAGRVDGDLRGSLRVELAASARVTGRIDTPRLAAADGAQIDGPCAVGRAPRAGEAPGEP